MFGEKIKVFAKKKFGSMTKLCEKIEMPTQQMWAYTSENSKPSYDVLTRLYEVGCDLNWLVDESKSINDFFEANSEPDEKEAFTKKEILFVKKLIFALQKNGIINEVGFSGGR